MLFAFEEQRKHCAKVLYILHLPAQTEGKRTLETKN